MYIIGKNWLTRVWQSLSVVGTKHWLDSLSAGAWKPQTVGEKHGGESARGRWLYWEHAPALAEPRLSSCSRASWGRKLKSGTWRKDSVEPESNSNISHRVMICYPVSDQQPSSDGFLSQFSQCNVTPVSLLICSHDQAVRCLRKSWHGRESIGSIELEIQDEGRK